MSVSSNEIVVRQDSAPSVFDVPPRVMLQNAVEMADVLKDVIKQQHLSVKIGPNEYVKVEAWATLGVMLGILPREREVKEHANGDYEAAVDLIRQRDGMVVGGASALCGADEQRWGKADRFARRSMAITRATGKAYRLCFAWIVTLAGYEPTPAEEMPEPSQAHTPQSFSGGFNPDDPHDRLWLKSEFVRRNIPPGVEQENWEKIGRAMSARPRTDVNRIIAEVMAP